MLSADEMDDFADDTHPAAVATLVEMDGVAKPGVLAPLTLGIAGQGCSAILGHGGAAQQVARMLAGTRPVPQGQVRFDGGDVLAARVRGRIAHVAGPMAEDLLTQIVGRVRGLGPRHPARAEALLDRVRGALAGPARLVVLDHPLDGIEGGARAVARDRLAELLGSVDRAVLLATADADLAARVADRVLILTGSPAILSEDMTLPAKGAGGAGRDAGFARDMAFRIRQAVGQVE